MFSLYRFLGLNPTPITTQVSPYLSQCRPVQRLEALQKFLKPHLKATGITQVPHFPGAQRT